MKKLLIFIGLALLANATFGQSVVQLRGDTVKVYKQGGYAEFVLKNSTQAKTGGFLKNASAGRTEFAYAVDTIYMASATELVFCRGDGCDTLVVAVSGSGTVTQINQGWGIVNTPNPIVGIGTVKADSSTLATYFLRRKDSANVTGLPTGYLTPDYYSFPFAVVESGQIVMLENDTSDHAVNYFYGSNEAGRYGWYPQSGITGVNIYNSNGTLTGDRTVIGDGNDLDINDLGQFTIYTANQMILQSGANFWANSPGAFSSTKVTAGDAGVTFEDGLAINFSGVSLYTSSVANPERNARIFINYFGTRYISIEPPQGNLKIDSLNAFPDTSYKAIVWKNGEVKVATYWPGGSGTVTSFAFTDGNGFDGTVTNSTTTPTLSLTTTAANKSVMYSNSGAIAASPIMTQETSTVVVSAIGPNPPLMIIAHEDLQGAMTMWKENNIDADSTTMVMRDSTIWLRDKVNNASTTKLGWGQIYFRADSFRVKNDAQVEFTLGRSTGSTGITVGSTAITGGTDTRVLFDDGGVVGEDAGFVFNKTDNKITVDKVTSLGNVTTETLIINYPGGSEAGRIIGTFTGTSGIYTQVNAGQYWGIQDNGPSGLILQLSMGSYPSYDNSTFYINARLNPKQGADVASANNLALGRDGNSWEITGTTQINLIDKGNWVNGAVIRLIFTSTPTVKNGQATSGNNITIMLAGAADFSATADDILTLELCEVGGTQAWREVSRSVN